MEPEIKIPSAKVAVRALRFWTEYKRAANGEMQPVDWVEFCAPGMAHISTITERVSRLEQDRIGRWASLQPFYEAWKHGQEAPTNGTPLGAWPGVSAQQVDVFKQNGLRTVEEVASMNDAVLSRISLPGIRYLRDEAGLFLKAKDTAGAEAEIRAMKAQNEALKAQMDEMIALMKATPASAEAMAELNPDLEGAIPAPRRSPGRPRREPLAAE
jgi:hypothetical protein